MEKIAQFDRERIPERVVHARGASAKGFFEVGHSYLAGLQAFEISSNCLCSGKMVERSEYFSIGKS